MAKPKPLVLCVLCIRARDDPHFRNPTHLVHPTGGERMLFDVHCIAVCPSCGARWRRWRNVTKLVE